MRWEALAGLTAQVSQGAGAVGIILVIRQHSGSLALAGVVVGTVSLAAGLARPVQGMLIDRRGTRGLMALCGLIHPAALIGIVALAPAHFAGGALIVLGAAAGLSLPPVSTSMRVVWGAAVPPGERTAAYSLVYLTQELSILLGPLVLSLLIALASPATALIGIALLAGAGTLSFAALVDRPRAGRAAREAGRARGALRGGALPILIAIAALTGAVIGALEVAAPTLASAHHAPAASGLLIAALSVGGVAGAVIYGSRRWDAVPAARLPALLALLAIALGAMVPAGELVLVGGLLLLGGVALNPVLTTISLLVDEHVAPVAAAEAFGWLSCGIAAGTGAANAIAGALTPAGHPRAAFAIAAIAGALALLFAALVRSRLARGALGGATVIRDEPI